jgi:uncharacterized iron-regulated membrane protein
VRFRKILFWIHLTCGVVAGLIIGIMSFTGVMLAFEKEIIAWAEKDLRRVPGGETARVRLPLDELLTKIRESRPDARSATLTLHADPTFAVLVAQGRTNAFHVDPYTGAIQASGAKRLRAFMQLMIDWHRYLARQGESRAIGKAVTGACNLAFLFLGASGVYLWWPRQWNRNSLRAIALFNFGLRGKARDWNWHNVIGLWTAPVIIVLTATAAPISYAWAGRLIHTLTGTEAPAQRPPAREPGTRDPRPSDQNLLGLGALVEAAQKAKPKWQQITVRPAISSQPVTVTIKEKNAWPLFASVQLTVDPRTAAVLREESYADLNTGLKVRRWTRFLHTGEALGPVGQAVAGLASLGGVFLVWTGFALAWRRFFQRKPRGAAVPVAIA